MTDFIDQWEITKDKKTTKVSERLSFEPTGHHLLIEAEALEEKTEWGLVLAKSQAQRAREQNGRNIGRLIKVGREAWNNKTYPWAKVGDLVYFARYSGPELGFKSHDSRYFIISDDDILGILTEKEASDLL